MITMRMWETLAVFSASMGVMAWASVRLTSALKRIGARWRLSEGFLGIMTALGADAPEIASAITALLSGHHEVGLGVVLGSNIFNLAGLLGLSALIAGRVEIRRQGLWLNGGISLIVSGVALALVLHWIPAWTSLLILAVVLIPYIALLAMSSSRVAQLPLPTAVMRFLGLAIGRNDSDQPKGATIAPASWRDEVWAALSLVLIVGSSVGTVRSAVWLGNAWDMTPGVVGTLLLAALTSVPNVIAAVRLAREGRGEAVISETLNSNTINILAGLCLPALLFGFNSPSPRIIFAALWLILMKGVALVGAGRPNGLRRLSGTVLVVLYLAFGVIIVLWK